MQSGRLRAGVSMYPCQISENAVNPYHSVQSLPSILEAKRLFGREEHRMAGGNMELDGRPFLIDTG